MMPLESHLEQLYVGHERMSRDEIYRRAVAAGLPPATMSRLETLPEGEYAQDEVGVAIAQLDPDTHPSDEGEGIPAETLSDEDLRRELANIHRTRHDTFLHGSASALVHHTERSDELEAEYLRRFPKREVDPQRLRPGLA